MGEQGADIKLSPAAWELIPYSFECKNTETGFTACYKAYDQALDNCTDKGGPIVIFKQNRKPALAIISTELLFDLIKGS